MQRAQRGAEGMDSVKGCAGCTEAQRRAAVIIGAFEVWDMFQDVVSTLVGLKTSNDHHCLSLVTTGCL